MSKEEKGTSNAVYYSIIGGEFRTQVPETHPEAQRRDWETRDGKKGTKYERTVKALFGKIEGIEIRDGEYGKSLNITLDQNEDKQNPVISVGTATRFGEDILKKLPHIDLSKEVRFRPYSYIPEGKDKEAKGVEITQQDEAGNFTVKVGNYFYDFEAKKALNGYPIPTDPSAMDTDDWQIFYKQANKFLVKYTEENIVPKFSQRKSAPVDYPEEDIDPNSVPF